MKAVVLSSSKSHILIRPGCVLVEGEGHGTGRGSPPRGHLEALHLPGPLLCPQVCMGQPVLQVLEVLKLLSGIVTLPLPQGRRWTGQEANAAPPTPCP